MHPILRVVPVLHPSTVKYLAFARAAGGLVQPTWIVKAIDDFVRGLWIAGIFPLLDCLYITAATDAVTAGINIVNPGAFTLVNHSSTFTALGGYQGNGTSTYVDSTYMGTTAGLNLTLNSAGLFNWTTIASTKGSGSANMGASNGVNGLCALRNNSGASGLSCNVNDQTANAATGATGIGFFQGHRYNSSKTDVWQNATLSGNQVAATSTTLVDATMILNGYNEPSSVGGFDNGQIALAGWGGGLSQSQASQLYNLSHKLMQTLAGVA